jgi:hypothetical protein
MTLFRPAEVSSAFLKMGILGFQGSGKTKTGTKTMIGLVQYAKERGMDYASKPVFFLDTETGSDWVIPDFQRAGIPLVTAKTRAFADLLKAIPEAEANGSGLLIDSVTHFWKDLCESYMRKMNRTRLQFEDWAYLKKEWGKFTDLYVNSSVHIVLCGRAGYEYDYAVDEDTQKKNLEKTGIKMKAEGETGFEPSLLVLMERDMDVRTNKVTHRATVLKDRSTLLDGLEFNDPDFKDFLPHIELLNLGGKQLGVDTSRNSDHLIIKDKRDWQPVQRKIVCDEIGTLLSLHYPGAKAEEKTAKLKALIKHFDASWTEIEEVMPLPRLRAGYDSLYRELEGRPSRYAREVEQAAVPEMNDEIQETGGAPAIAPNGDAPALSLKDKLLAQLGTLTTIAECTHWGIEVSNMKDLSAEDYLALSKALMARQNAIAKNPGNGNGGDDPKKNEPDGGKGEEGKPPMQEPKPEPERRVASGKGKNATAQAESSYADLMTAG